MYGERLKPKLYQVVGYAPDNNKPVPTEPCITHAVRAQSTVLEYGTKRFWPNLVRPDPTARTSITSTRWINVPYQILRDLPK